MSAGAALAVGGALCAGAAGWLGWSAWQAKREAAARISAVRASAGIEEHTARGADMGEQVLRYARRLSQALVLGASRPLIPADALKKVRMVLLERRRHAGLDSDVSADGLLEASVRLGAAGAALGAVAGAVFSEGLLLIGGLAGLAVGASAPLRALGSLEHKRAAALGHDLPEMLEVCALGLRSGLSFDRSFALYGAHFTTALAQECVHAQSLWAMGLMTREEALRSLAARYASATLGRAVESMARSLRFGSSLVEVLESAAAQARADYRAVVEERVAKAPVKMMIPTGALILPAMLLLVLGPVLLQLMEGM